MGGMLGIRALTTRMLVYPHRDKPTVVDLWCSGGFESDRKPRYAVTLRVGDPDSERRQLVTMAPDAARKLAASLVAMADAADRTHARRAKAGGKDA